MALDTYRVIWNQVLLRCPLVGPMMAQQFVQHAFRDLVERRKWSWLIKRSQFVFPNQYTTGTVTVTNNSNAVVGVGTTWTSAMIGRQFRISLLTPIYDIIAVPSATSLTLSDVWGGTTQAGVTYQIYLAYPLPPTDFHSFTSVYDPNFSWSLWLTVKQEELNMYDAQRAAQGTPYVVADYDYTNLQLGGAAITPPIPRFEVWPHQTAAYVIPFIYESRPPDLNDSGATLPRYIPGNVLLEGALSQCARWPGTDRAHVNPYFNLALAQQHQKRFDDLVDRMQVQDDEIYERDINYGQYSTFPLAPLPFPINAAYLQTHAF